MECISYGYVISSLECVNTIRAIEVILGWHTSLTCEWNTVESWFSNKSIRIHIAKTKQLNLFWTVMACNPRDFHSSFRCRGHSLNAFQFILRDSEMRCLLFSYRHSRFTSMDAEKSVTFILKYRYLSLLFIWTTTED